MSMKLRKYRPSDHASVMDLHFAGLDEHGINKGLGPWDDDLHDIETTYHQRGGLFLVGHMDDEIIGMGALQRLDSDTGEIKRMRVRKDQRRKGYGQAVLDALLQFAEKNGINHLILDTTDVQAAALGLYLKNGFKEIRREESGHVVNVFFQRDTDAARRAGG
jgi:ribosomal protein S18 acetylase RimI-like enzyme